MVGAADRLNYVSPRTEIFERLKPRVEYRFHACVVFEIPAVDRASAGILIKVGVEFVACRFIRVTGEIFGDIFLRAKQALLLTIPYREPDRPAGLGTDGL